LSARREESTPGGAPEAGSETGYGIDSGIDSGSNSGNTPAEQKIISIPGMIPAFLLVLLAFGGWALLLPVIPLHIVRSGGGDVLAGASTGVFMAVTVLTQILTPRLLRRFGYRLVLGAGALLLSGPAALYLLGAEAAVVLPVSAVRGAGFGMLTVAGSALVAELAPPSRLGRATSLIGLAIGVAEAGFLPLGLYTFEHLGLEFPAITASALAVVGLGAAIRVPQLFPQDPAKDDAQMIRGHGIAYRLAPAMALMLTVAMAFGVTSTFLPPSLDDVGGAGAGMAGLALSIVGVMVVVGRTIAGTRADRNGPGDYIPIGMASAAIGVGGFGLLAALGAPFWAFLVAAMFFGFGFGAIQNESLLGAFQRLPKSQLGTASAGWNIAFDGGTGLGALVIGLFAFAGYSAMFCIAAAACVLVGTLITPYWRHLVATGNAVH